VEAECHQAAVGAAAAVMGAGKVAAVAVEAGWWRVLLVRSAVGSAPHPAGASGGHLQCWLLKPDGGRLTDREHGSNTAEVTAHV